jgi:hypothetical protein
MKEFARICVETGNSNIISNLERVLNLEVAILNQESEDDAKLLKLGGKHTPEVDPRVLAQPQFRFSSVPDKLKMMNNYMDLIKDQEKTREAIRMLEASTEDPAVFAQLTKDFTQLFNLIKEFEEGNSNFDMHFDG